MSVLNNESKSDKFNLKIISHTVKKDVYSTDSIQYDIHKNKVINDDAASI